MSEKNRMRREKWLQEMRGELRGYIIKRFYNKNLIDEIFSKTIEYILTVKENHHLYKKHITFESFRQYTFNNAYSIGLTLVFEESKKTSIDIMPELLEVSEPIEYITTAGKIDLEKIIISLVKKKKLSANYGKMLKLRLYQVSYAEIARQMKLSRGAISLAFTRKIIPLLEQEANLQN